MPQIGGKASTSLAMLPEVDKPLPWLPSYTEDTTFTISDAVSFALWIRDPLYRTAASSVRRAMEMEEASFLLHESERGWKEHNGRARGWVRKHLEEDLRLRSGGGEPSSDSWDQVRTNKRAALLVDYICCMRDLRWALWWPEQKTVTVIPMVAIPSNPAIYQLNCMSGRILLGERGFSVAAPSWPNLLPKAIDMTWIPPTCSPSIGSQTVGQIKDQLESLKPGSPLTGGRLGIWNRFLWASFEKALTPQNVTPKSPP
jgi:hypothetical protein